MVFIEILTEKLIRRHPHVFGDVDVEDSDEVVKNWEAIKRQEAGYEDRESVLDGIPNALPMLTPRTEDTEPRSTCRF